MCGKVRREQQISLEEKEKSFRISHQDPPAYLCVCVCVCAKFEHFLLRTFLYNKCLPLLITEVQWVITERHNGAVGLQNTTTGPQVF